MKSFLIGSSLVKIIFNNYKKNIANVKSEKDQLHIVLSLNIQKDNFCDLDFDLFDRKRTILKYF